jgi:hypothetical protein
VSIFNRVFFAVNKSAQKQVEIAEKNSFKAIISNGAFFLIWPVSGYKQFRDSRLIKPSTSTGRKGTLFVFIGNKTLRS